MATPTAKSPEATLLDALCAQVVVPPTTADHWRAIERALAAPFEPWEVDFRVSHHKKPAKMASVVAYVDRVVVIRRLNRVVGIQNWTHDPEPVVTERGKVLVAKGYVSIFGITKASFGDADPGADEATKTSDSDSLKRGATEWGVGNYLAELAIPRQPCDEEGYMAPGTVVNLRAQLAAGKLWKSPEAAAFYGLRLSAEALLRTTTTTDRTDETTPPPAPAPHGDGDPLADEVAEALAEEDPAPTPIRPAAPVPTTGGSYSWQTEYERAGRLGLKGKWSAIKAQCKGNLDIVHGYLDECEETQRSHQKRPA